MANTTAPPNPDMDTGDMSTSLPPSSANIQANIDNTLSVHQDADNTNIVALMVAASAFLLREFHPRSTNIPEDTINSILEIFHYTIPHTQIVDIMLHGPDFMALLASRAPQLLPAANTPARPHSRQAGPCQSRASPKGSGQGPSGDGGSSGSGHAEEDV
ncbi:hypothetical protein BOTBODRAFT_177309 [Botryobasidium botryosum FD-172 SS1]|uniref:Uncharacterized protein n=1 Tax=Botryobasidium botryosum (strain FD-172 SS1) TaxID=930990 RepID=A0A067M6S6_BOTB1|nr:hypothetical protein BOTBODRAFT_177309 [Botryobasidium botryosum FD-172 SS1]